MDLAGKANISTSSLFGAGDPSIDGSQIWGSARQGAQRLGGLYQTAWRLAIPDSNQTVCVATVETIMSMSDLDKAIIEQIKLCCFKPSASRVNQDQFNQALALTALAQQTGSTPSLELLLQTYGPSEWPEPRVNDIMSLALGTSTITSSNYTTIPISKVTNGALSVPASVDLNRGMNVPDNSQFSGLNTLDDIRSSLAVVGGDPDFTGSSSLRSSLSASHLHARDTESLNNFQGCLDEDQIKIHIAKEKGGNVFKHVNYIVESQRHRSNVTRRYSDFVWLLEILTKRYPFRILPSLPPKKLVGADDVFIEKRRKGLARFMRSVANHPVMRMDMLIIDFLTYQRDMAEYRKTKSVDETEETATLSTDLSNTNGQPCSYVTPQDAEERLKQFKSDLSSIISVRGMMVTMMERMCQRSVGNAVDMKKYGNILDKSVTEGLNDCFQGRCQSCEHVDNGMKNIGQFMLSIADNHEEQARFGFENIVERLKQQHDLYLGFIELFQRRDKLLITEFDTAQKRITANQSKLQAMQSKASTASNLTSSVPSSANPSTSTEKGARSEVEKLEAVIRQDESFIETNKKRNAIALWMTWCEFQWLHRNKSGVPVSHGQHAAGMVRSLEKLTDLYRRLLVNVEDMLGSGI